MAFAIKERRRRTDQYYTDPTKFNLIKQSKECSLFIHAFRACTGKIRASTHSLNWWLEERSCFLCWLPVEVAL
jgi:hypothetical protein